MTVADDYEGCCGGNIPFPGPWSDRGRCRLGGPGVTALFFPERGESCAEAKSVCRPCPVRAECLSYALPHPHLSGIWGGTSGRERARMRAGLEAEPVERAS